MVYVDGNCMLAKRVCPTFPGSEMTKHCMPKNQGDVPATLPAVDMLVGLESERCDEVLPATLLVAAVGESVPVAVRSHPH